MTDQIDYTYFIYSMTFRLMKIGRTANSDFLRNRWRPYITESPERLTPILVVRSYHNLERMIHEDAAQWRTHGEWFEWPAALKPVRNVLSNYTYIPARVFHAPMADAIMESMYPTRVLHRPDEDLFATQKEVPATAPRTDEDLFA